MSVMTPGSGALTALALLTAALLAAGASSEAAAVAAFWMEETEHEVTVHLKGGNLFIQYDPIDKKVYMTGPATEVFRGQLSV
jgi:diaminopimelate epimerase